MSNPLEIQKSEKSVFIHQNELIQLGCLNCVWKLHHQCPHGYIGTEFFDSVDPITKERVVGICPDFIEFLLRLGDTKSEIMEAFHLHIAELESLTDYRIYKELESEIIAIESGGKPYNSEELQRLSEKKYVAKMWWSKLNDQILKYRKGINDRDSRIKDDLTITHKISLSQIHQLANAAKKIIEQGPANE